MKNLKPAIAFLCLLSFSVPAQAVINPFIRAGVDFSKLNGISKLQSNDSWKDKLSGWNAGYFAEAGITFLGSHTLAVEAGYMRASSSVGETEAGVTSREQIPLLLNYRHSLNLGPVSLYLGISAGMMSDTAKWQDDIHGATGSWDSFKSANWVGLYGATAGLGLKLGKGWAVDVGVRALAVSGKQYQAGVLSDAGNSYGIGSSKIYVRPNVRLALSHRW